LIGRLKPGVTAKQAQAELNSIAKGMEPGRPDVDGDWSVRVESLHEWLVGGSRRYFYLLLGAVGFVLLIACANVANLLLARGTVRQKEIAIRASLGAGRWRLIRQLLAETVLLALVGGAVGVLVGFVGTPTLVSIAPIDRIHSLPVTIDLRVLGFTLCLSLLTGILFGLMPAFRTSKSDLYDSLKEGGRQSSGASRQRGQSLLLVSEIALALVLLVGAGLMVNSFLRMQNVELGFNPKNVLRADVFRDGPKFWHNSPGVPGTMKTVTPQGDAFFREVLERIHAIPGVVSMGISHLAPPSRDVQPVAFTIIGRPVSSSGSTYWRYMKLPALRAARRRIVSAHGMSWAPSHCESLGRGLGLLLDVGADIAQGDVLILP
jgi:putative ABC transport system permease protein